MDPRNQPAQDDEDLLRDIRKILDDRHDADDPYERGFADKLYEDCEDPTLQTQQPPRRQQNSVSGPVIHAYNSDFRRGAAPQRREEPTTYLGPVEEDDYEPPCRQSQRSRREPERAPRREEQPRRHRAVPESGYDAEPPKKKKKHRFARGLGKLLLILLVLFALVIGVMLLLAKQPKAEETLGARRDGCSTILLAGTDKSGDRTDTVMLLSVDRSAKRLTLLSIPRDTKVNSTYTPHKINIAYGVNGKDQEGMEALMDYVTELVGFRPDGYVLIDLDVFVDLVDKMGGVKFDVPCDMDYSDPAQDLTIDLKAGMQRLNGPRALPLRLCHGRSAARERAAGFYAGCHAPVGLRLEPLAFALGGAAALGAYRYGPQHTQSRLAGRVRRPVRHVEPADAHHPLYVQRRRYVCSGRPL